MRLLVVTQTLDRSDPTLGFFVSWVDELSRRVDRVTVICLREGEYALPSNVIVKTLGKRHSGKSNFFQKVVYGARFVFFSVTSSYDRVFVHMNEEYVLLQGDFWRLTGRKVFLWRNHYKGSLYTQMAGMVATKVFATSRYSFTAAFKNSVLMPVGVDVGSLLPSTPVERVPNSILFLARLDPSKRPELILRALARLKERNIPFTATFVGGSRDDAYADSIGALSHELNLADRVTFTGAVPNTETFRYYRSHEIYVNAAQSGMLDKTIFKAMAAGCLPLTSSQDLEPLVPGELIFKENDAVSLAEKLAALLEASAEKKEELRAPLPQIVANNSLTVLMDRLIEEMS